MPGNHKNHTEKFKLNFKQALISRDILTIILKTFNYTYIKENEIGVINMINTELVFHNELPIYSISKLNGWISNNKYKNCIPYKVKEIQLKTRRLKKRHLRASRLKASRLKASRLKEQRLKEQLLKEQDFSTVCMFDYDYNYDLIDEIIKSKELHGILPLF
jgi:protein tyrosine phosphatase